MAPDRPGQEKPKGQEKQSESFFSQFNFKRFLGDAAKSKKDPEMPKRIAARKNKKVVHGKSGEKLLNGDKSETPEETELKKIADNLAHTAKKVEVKTDSFDETKNTIKIDLDLTKFKDLPKAELTEVLTPEVKSCNLKIYETNDKGEREVKDEKVVFRGIEDGKVNYFFKDKEGKNVPVSLPLTGGAELTINPDQLENKSRAEVLVLMKEELVKTSKKALNKRMDVAADSLFEVPAAPRRSFGGGARSGGIYRGSRVVSDAVEAVDTVGADTLPKTVASVESSVSLPESNGEAIRSGDRVLKYPMSAEAADLIKTYSSKDKFVKFKDDYNRRNFKLRETTYKCLELARQYAKADGYDITIHSAYRDMASQKAAFNRSDGSGTMVAAPGSSWHHSGAATDCYLVKDGKILSSTGGRADNATGAKKEANDRLESYMNKAGFVRYRVEAWHFEVGSTDWAKIMTKAGALSQQYVANEGAYRRLRA